MRYINIRLNASFRHGAAGGSRDRPDIKVAGRPSRRRSFEGERADGGAQRCRHSSDGEGDRFPAAFVFLPCREGGALHSRRGHSGCRAIGDEPADPAPGARPRRATARSNRSWRQADDAWRDSVSPSGGDSVQHGADDRRVAESQSSAAGNHQHRGAAEFHGVIHGGCDQRLYQGASGRANLRGRGLDWRCLQSSGQRPGRCGGGPANGEHGAAFAPRTGTGTALPRGRQWTSDRVRKR